MYKDRLKQTKEAVVEWNACIGAPNNNMGTCQGSRSTGYGKGVLLKDTVGIGKEENIAITVSGPDISCLCCAGACIQPDELAGEAFYHLNRVILGTVIDCDDLEVSVSGRKGGFEALSYCGASLIVGNYDGDKFIHRPPKIKLKNNNTRACPGCRWGFGKIKARIFNLFNILGP